MGNTKYTDIKKVRHLRLLASETTGQSKILGLAGGKKLVSDGYTAIDVHARLQYMHRDTYEERTMNNGTDRVQG